MKSGVIYIHLEIINMIFLLIWSIWLLSVLCTGRYWSFGAIVYALPNLAWVFHFIAVTYWCVESGVSFGLTINGS